MATTNWNRNQTAINTIVLKEIVRQFKVSSCHRFLGSYNIMIFEKKYFYFELIDSALIDFIYCYSLASRYFWQWQILVKHSVVVWLPAAIAMATTASDINVLHKCVRAMNLDGFSVYPSIKWLVILHNVEMPRIIKCAIIPNDDSTCKTMTTTTMTIVCRQWPFSAQLDTYRYFRSTLRKACGIEIHVELKVLWSYNCSLVCC